MSQVALCDREEKERSDPRLTKSIVDTSEGGDRGVPVQWRVVPDQRDERDGEATEEEATVGVVQEHHSSGTEQVSPALSETSLPSPPTMPNPPSQRQLELQRKWDLEREKHARLLRVSQCFCQMCTIVCVPRMHSHLPSLPPLAH